MLEGGRLSGTWHTVECRIKAYIKSSVLYKLHEIKVFYVKHTRIAYIEYSEVIQDVLFVNYACELK